MIYFCKFCNNNFVFNGETVFCPKCENKSIITEEENKKEKQALKYYMFNRRHSNINKVYK